MAEHKSTLTVVARLTRLLDFDVNVEENLNGVCDERSPPVNDEHDGAAQESTKKGEPHVVIFICWSPAWYKEESEKTWLSKHSGKGNTNNTICVHNLRKKKYIIDYMSSYLVLF